MMQFYHLQPRPGCSARTAASPMSTESSSTGVSTSLSSSSGASGQTTRQGMFRMWFCTDPYGARPYRGCVCCTAVLGAALYVMMNSGFDPTSPMLPVLPGSLQFTPGTALAVLTYFAIWGLSCLFAEELAPFTSAWQYGKATRSIVVYAPFAGTLVAAVFSLAVIVSVHIFLLSAAISIQNETKEESLNMPLSASMAFIRLHTDTSIGWTAAALQATIAALWAPLRSAVLPHMKYVVVWTIRIVAHAYRVSASAIVPELSSIGSAFLSSIHSFYSVLLERSQLLRVIKVSVKKLWVYPFVRDASGLPSFAEHLFFTAADFASFTAKTAFVAVRTLYGKADLSGAARATRDALSVLGGYVSGHLPKVVTFTGCIRGAAASLWRTASARLGFMVDEHIGLYRAQHLVAAALCGACIAGTLCVVYELFRALINMVRGGSKTRQRPVVEGNLMWIAGSAAAAAVWSLAVSLPRFVHPLDAINGSELPIIESYIFKLPRASETVAKALVPPIFSDIQLDQLDGVTTSVGASIGALIAVSLVSLGSSCLRWNPGFSRKPDDITAPAPVVADVVEPVDASPPLGAEPAISCPTYSANYAARLDWDRNERQRQATHTDRRRSSLDGARPRSSVPRRASLGDGGCYDDTAGAVKPAVVQRCCSYAEAYEKQGRRSIENGGSARVSIQRNNSSSQRALPSIPPSMKLTRRNSEQGSPHLTAPSAAAVAESQLPGFQRTTNTPKGDDNNNMSTTNSPKSAIRSYVEEHLKVNQHEGNENRGGNVEHSPVSRRTRSNSTAARRTGRKSSGKEATYTDIFLASQQSPKATQEKERDDSSAPRKKSSAVDDQMAVWGNMNLEEVMQTPRPECAAPSRPSSSGNVAESLKGFAWSVDVTPFTSQPLHRVFSGLTTRNACETSKKPLSAPHAGESLRRHSHDSRSREPTPPNEKSTTILPAAQLASVSHKENNTTTARRPPARIKDGPSVTSAIPPPRRMSSLSRAPQTKPNNNRVAVSSRAGSSGHLPRAAGSRGPSQSPVSRSSSGPLRRASAVAGQASPLSSNQSNFKRQPAVDLQKDKSFTSHSLKSGVPQKISYRTECQSRHQSDTSGKSSSICSVKGEDVDAPIFQTSDDEDRSDLQEASHDGMHRLVSQRQY